MEGKLVSSRGCRLEENQITLQRSTGDRLAREPRAGNEGRGVGRLDPLLEREHCRGRLG